MTSLLVSAGELISSEMGFSLARTMNPESGVDATVVSQLLQVLGFLLILQFDLHHDALRVLEHTYRACPIGQPFDIEPIWLGLQRTGRRQRRARGAVRFPILGLMLLLSVGMVLLGRAVPNINLMEFGFALRVLLAIGAMAYFLGEGTPFLLQTFRSVLEQSAPMFGG
jgi:flagellar biosynthetic protein FliR